MTQHLGNKKIYPDLTEEDIVKNNRLATHYSGTVPSKVTLTKERDHTLSSSPVTGLETAIQRPPSINSIPASEQNRFQTKPQQVPVERPAAHKDRRRSIDITIGKSSRQCFGPVKIFYEWLKTISFFDLTTTQLGHQRLQR